MAAALEALRQGSSTIASTDLPEDQLLQLIPDAARAVGLPTEQVIRSIRPQTSSRASAESKTVEVGMEGLTLDQLVRYLHYLRSNNQQFQITAMTLSEPKGLGSATLWRVEPLVLPIACPKRAAGINPENGVPHAELPVSSADADQRNAGRLCPPPEGRRAETPANSGAALEELTTGTKLLNEGKLDDAEKHLLKAVEAESFSGLAQQSRQAVLPQGPLL